MCCGVLTVCDSSFEVYELVVLLKPKLSAVGVDEALDRLRKLLAELGASDVVSTRWGLTKLAYRIRSSDAAFGLHFGFKLKRSRLFKLQLAVSSALKTKVLRLGLFLSTAASLKIKPSFCSDTVGE
ncbi:MAG: 30S ribosomal protein S6 [Candidatus Hodgkinia cicadicola]|nr:MAG: 30S ribosomal protein S6 [Candidatus Hodgkinia cicadicola]